MTPHDALPHYSALESHHCQSTLLCFRHKGLLVSFGMLARSSGASFRAGLSAPTDKCVEQYCVVFACDVLFVGFVPL
jgi:hypothetical protein